MSISVGNIFDFWRRDSVEILDANRDIIGKLLSFPNNVKVHYVVGITIIT
jgi:UDP-2,3-diacylglucosamine pyrophosphatase LpxH